MIENPENNFNVLEFLSHVDVSDEEIDNFRKDRVLSERIDLFNVIKKEKQMIMIAIDQLPIGQLNRLIELAKTKDKERMFVIHDIKSALLDLNNCTEDEKMTIKEIFRYTKTILKKQISILWIFSVALGFALIVFADKNKLPLGTGDFVFFAILALFVALYRPRWIFFLFVSFVPLENIILVGGFLPLQLRPYQFLGGILIVAVAILYIFKKLKFELLKPNWIDWLIFSLFSLSLLAVLNAPNKSATLKQNLVLISFVALYYLVRNFIRTKDDLIKTTFFFVGSFLVVVIYGFYQVFADKFGWQSFEIMFGRPNSTFAEPDWLGIFLCFALAVLLSAFHYCHPERSRGIFVNNTMTSHNLSIKISPLLQLKPKSVEMTRIVTLFLIFFNLTLLILTLSRSAWIGTAVIIVFYLILNLYKKTEGGIKLTIQNFTNKLAVVALIILFSLAAIRVGGLSKFDIFDRARSTTTSEQKITIACKSNINVPASIRDVGELSKYNCRHINLEEINYYKSQGKIVTEIYRKDPNVLTRGQIYQKSWQIIKRHPVLGVGFGTITQKLGIDARGAGLNESNIFLQIWVGSGILGLIAFLVAIGYLFMHSFRKLSPVCPLEKWFSCPAVKNEFERSLAIFTVLGILALIIPNLFNAGLFMGIFWLGLTTIVSSKEIR